MSELAKLKREIRKLQRDVAKFQRRNERMQIEFKQLAAQLRANRTQAVELIQVHNDQMGEFRRSVEERLRRQGGNCWGGVRRD